MVICCLLIVTHCLLFKFFFLNLWFRSDTDNGIFPKSKIFLVSFLAGIILNVVSFI